MKISDLEGEVNVKAIAYSKIGKYQFASRHENKRYPFETEPERRDDIFWCFSWGKTPEGEDYWYNVNKTGKP
jgi:hypothetical protein